MTPDDYRLLDAAQTGNSKSAAALLDAGADVNNKGMPLSWAISNGHSDMAHMLIARGADVNARNQENHYRPLHYAAALGNVAVTKLLIDKGADMTALNMHEETPRALAERCSHPDVVKLIDEALQTQGHARRVTERRKGFSERG
jgi:ankyrin repeat protein